MAAFDMRRTLLLRAISLRNPRMLAVFLALMVGAAIVGALLAVYFDINIKMSQELRAFGANFYVGPARGSAMREADFDAALAAAPQGLVNAGSPYLYGTARSELERIALAGVRFSALRQLAPYWQVQGDWIGVDFDERNAMIGRTLAQRLELQVGGTLTLLKDGDRYPLRIKGIIDAGDASDSLLFVNLPLAQRWLDMPGAMSHALFSLDSRGAGQAEALAGKLQAAHPDWSVRPIRKVSASEGAVLLKIQGLMGLISVVILLLSTLCVNTSLTAIISERKKEFALQKALGASNRAIVQQVLLETLVIALIATLLGCALGLALAQLLGQSVFSAWISLRARVIPITLALSTLVALAAGMAPLRRIMRIEPAIVLKGE
ncbi:MAG: ABC transporter permease [Burkholderiaceae bacterium]|jgi:putative ABC transport system permease protein|nr:ABC transporter permease [Burkholderiaceae bacterium]